jgi:hypothetical protein
MRREKQKGERNILTLLLAILLLLINRGVKSMCICLLVIVVFEKLFYTN